MITDINTYKAFRNADILANSRPIKRNIRYKLRNFIIPDYIMRFLFLLRKTEYYKNCKKGLTGRLIFSYYYIKFKKLSLKLGFSIPLNVFGAGLSIPHYGTIVVNPAAQIGKNCRLHTSVNIGSTGGSVLAPKIGDNVYIGPGAIIFGDVIVADNISISANATVNRSFDVLNVTIGGTPAKILKENSTVWWIKNGLDLSVGIV